MIKISVEETIRNNIQNPYWMYSGAIENNRSQSMEFNAVGFTPREFEKLSDDLEEFMVKWLAENNKPKRMYIDH